MRFAWFVLVNEGRTPYKTNRRHRWNEKDEACFGTPINHDQFTKEFDFEKNLALFNKQVGDIYIYEIIYI